MAETVVIDSRIDRKDNVCGGAACIRGTRLPVWGLQAARQRGISDREILEMYPFLSQDDLDAAWVFVLNHEDEIRSQILENEEA